MHPDSQTGVGPAQTDEIFQSTVTAEEFVQATTRALLARGFNAQNTLTCVSVCRDEYMRSFVSLIEARWGPAFQLGGVAGAVFVGEGGWSAAMTHAPSTGTQRRMAIWVLPHIGRVAGRPPGITLRRGVAEPVPTCGTLALLRARHVLAQERKDETPAALLVGADPGVSLPADIEVAALVQRLRSAGPIPGTIEAMTRRVHDCAVEDAVSLLRLSAGRGFETAISSGIVIHEDGGDRVWAGREAEDVPAAGQP
jgi:hypothetical protein